MIKVSVDIGGVISRHPLIYKSILRALAASPEIDLYILTDMEREDAWDALYRNGLDDVISDRNLLCADWAAHGELCKAILCELVGIDLHIDDLPSYLLGKGTVGLLQMPSNDPYNSKEWVK